ICYAFGAVVLLTGVVCLIQYVRVRGSGFTAPFLLVGGITSSRTPRTIKAMLSSSMPFFT
ncbi:hypothetical protein, partial [Gemmiger formicilis]|uniref:hypothetical protein n=1 Tax=Gemmiger formicilis TaxID=745368 RepID=UPI00195E0F8F